MEALKQAPHSCVFESEKNLHFSEGIEIDYVTSEGSFQPVLGIIFPLILIPGHSLGFFVCFVFFFFTKRIVWSRYQLQDGEGRDPLTAALF